MDIKMIKEARENHINCWKEAFAKQWVDVQKYICHRIETGLPVTVVYYNETTGVLRYESTCSNAGRQVAQVAVRLEPVLQTPVLKEWGWEPQNQGWWAFNVAAAVNANK